MKLRTRPNYDATDLEHLRQSVATRGWQMITDRVGEMIEAERTSCEHATEIEDLRRAQGALSALRKVLQLPDILRRELKQRER